MKKPAYGLNDAPRRWWNIVDGKLRQYGLIPTRADRCTYVMYGQEKEASLKRTEKEENKASLQPLDAIEYLLDPIMNNNAQGRRVHGTVCLHVDDLFLAGDSYFHKTIVN